MIFSASQIFIGGAANALKSFCSSIPKNSLLLASAIIVISVFGVQFFSIVQAILKKRLSSLSLGAKLWHRGKCSEMVLMIDSGNLVREYETKRRVIFVKAEAIQNSVGDCDTIFEREKCYVIPIDTASGRSKVMGFIPDKLEFSDKKYNEEDFLIVPDMTKGSFAGYDGIVPLI